MKWTESDWRKHAQSFPNFLAPLIKELGRSERRAGAAPYVEGLLLPGQRKSIACILTALCGRGVGPRIVTLRIEVNQGRIPSSPGRGRAEKVKPVPSATARPEETIQQKSGRKTKRKEKQKAAIRSNP